MSFQEIPLSSENKASNYIATKVDNIFSTNTNTFIKNIRNDNSALPFLNYNATTKEISYKNIVVPTSATYASFYNDTASIPFTQNTAVALQFNNTFFSNGISYNVGTPSRIEFTSNGVYSITIQAQLEEAGGSSADVYGSLYKNGSLIPNSCTLVQIQGNNKKEHEIANKLFSITDYTTEYIEFKAFTTSTGITAETYQSPDPSMAVSPSLVCNIIQII